MRARNFVVLPLGLLLIAAQFTAMYYDARHGVAHYRDQVAASLPAHR
jgi:hypothetical protein